MLLATFRDIDGERHNLLSGSKHRHGNRNKRVLIKSQQIEGVHRITIPHLLKHRILGTTMMMALTSITPSVPLQLPNPYCISMIFPHHTSLFP
jgi:hypothetical protein